MASETVRPNPLRWTKVVLVGLAGGALAGYLIVFGSGLMSVSSEGAFAPFLFGLTGAVFGAPFGATTFPLCYYLLISDVPLPRAFLVAMIGTVLFAWAGELVYARVNAQFNDGLAAFVGLYGPGALGLVVSCLALRVFGGRDRTLFSPATIGGVAIACVVIAAIVCVTLRGRGPVQGDDLSTIMNSIPAPAGARVVDGHDAWGEYGDDSKPRTTLSALVFQTSLSWGEIQNHYRVQFRANGWIECHQGRNANMLTFSKGAYLGSVSYYPPDANNYEFDMEHGPRLGCRAPFIKG